VPDQGVSPADLELEEHAANVACDGFDACSSPGCDVPSRASVHEQRRYLPLRGRKRRSLRDARARYADEQERNAAMFKGRKPCRLRRLRSPLRAAYPNYYLDTQLFVQALEAATTVRLPRASSSSSSSP
jgi:hypothetical protein